jgi:hypothetical protein
MMPDLFEQESNMSNKLLGAAAMVASLLAVQPASAAKMGGCSSENLAKTESMIEAMADGEGKMAAQKEIAQAQDAMLNGKMGACAAHLGKAMHAGMGSKKAPLHSSLRGAANASAQASRGGGEPGIQK